MSICTKIFIKMKNIIICDFDETITSRDTISILGELPYVINPSLEPKWAHYQQLYFKNYFEFQTDPLSLGIKQLPARTLPLLSSSTGPVTSLNFDGLFSKEIQYQVDKRLLELSSINEMERHKLFKGIAEADISQYVEERYQGDNSLLREGFNDFISSLNDYELYVISINWSKEFIQQVTGVQIIKTLNIFCNDLIAKGGVYTGAFSKKILTGSDKLHKLNELIGENEQNPSCTRFWYIGDSETDLLTILHPSVNGLLLLDPYSEEKKFNKLTSQFLGLDSNISKNFVADISRTWMKCIDKENGNGVFLVKSWAACKDILNKV